MGLEDRDWYREKTAKKNGMRYNKRNATYSAASAQDVLDSSIRNLNAHSSSRIRAVEAMRASNRRNWSGIFYACAAVVSFTVAGLLLIRATT